MFVVLVRLRRSWFRVVGREVGVRPRYFGPLLFKYSVIDV